MKKKNSFIPNFGKKGWLIAILGICFYFLYLSVFDTGLNFLLDFYNTTYGWSTTSVSFFVSLGGWLGLIGILLFGQLCKKKGAKFVCILGLVMAAVAFVLIGCTASLVMFAIGIIIYWFGAYAYGIIGVGQFGANWFPRTKGMYMGIATMGITIASATINLIMAAIIPNFGIRVFMIIFAIVCVVVALVTSRVKNYPEEAGAYPDNDKSVSRAELDKAAQEMEAYKKNTVWTTKKILMTKETWLIGIAWGIPMLAASGMLSQLTLALMSYGHDITFGIALLSSMWPVGVIGNYIGGVIDEKFGTKTISFLVPALLIVGSAIVLFGGANKPLAAIGVGIYMFTVSCGSNTTMSITQSTFGRMDFENAWPVISVINRACMAAGVFVIAAIASLGYKVAFIGVIIFAVVSILLMFGVSGKCITQKAEEH